MFRAAIPALRPPAGYRNLPEKLLAREKMALAKFLAKSLLWV
jgi:hypothetical protein